MNHRDAGEPPTTGRDFPDDRQPTGDRSNDDRLTEHRPTDGQPTDRLQAANRLQEYVRTRGIRGRVPSQAHPLSGSDRRDRPAPAGPAPAGPALARPAAARTVTVAALQPAARPRVRDRAARPALAPRIRPPRIDLDSTARSIARSIRSGGFRLAFGLTGAVATVAVVGALVMALPSTHVAATPPPSSGSVYGVTWSAAAQPPSANFDFGPYFTSSGATLLMAGTTGSSTTVWSSTDGSAWTQISDSGSFDMNGRRFVAQGLSGDGDGGLVIVGNSVGSGAAPAADSVGNPAATLGATSGTPSTTSADISTPGSAASAAPDASSTTDVTATAWHSEDGHTWTQANVDAAEGQEMIGGVAARSNGIVAAGNGIAWHSSDGLDWKPVAMPAAQAFIPREVGAWDGGFAIVGLAGGSSTVRSAVWYSSDGTSWTQASTVLDGFDARGIAGIGDRILVVGSDTSDTAEGLAASWTSTDGDVWTQATAPTKQTTVAIDSVIAFDGSFIAVGGPEESATGQTQSQAPATEETWITDDGLGWLSLTTQSPPVERGRLASIAGKLVLAGVGEESVTVFEGAVQLGPPRVATVTATPAIVYSLDLTAGTVPMIPDITTADTLGPLVATSDRFVAFTTGGAGTSVWTSTDGGHLWAQEAKPATLTASGNTGRPVVLQAIADGRGGVLAIGSVTSANGSTGTIWHRTADGWHQVTIQDDAPPEFSSIAAGTNAYVASSDKAGGSSLMYSTDGETWYASSISVGEGFALTVGTYQYGFVAVGTNAARGGASAAWTSPDGRTWTLRSDWKLPPNVTALFGVGRFLVAASTVTPGVVAPTIAPAASGSPSASGSAVASSSAKAKATPKPTPTPAPTPAPTPGTPYVQWWWSGTGESWQQTSLQTSTTNYALVNDEIFVIDPPAGGASDWTAWSSSDGRNWIRPVSDPIAFRGAKVCALAALSNNLVIVGWDAPGQLKGYFGKLISQTAGPSSAPSSGASGVPSGGASSTPLSAPSAEGTAEQTP